MSMTKAAIIAAARERADAVRSGRWSDADLGVLLGALHWREWSHILSSNNVYKKRTVTVTPSATGVIAKSDLSSATQFFFRILSVYGGDRFYAPIAYKDAPLPSTFNNFRGSAWYEDGDGIQLVPASTSSVDVTVNYRPKRASALDDGDTVDFPDGHEHVLIYGLAGEMLLKGGAETEAASDMFNFQRILREDMLSDIGRLSVKPRVVEAMDDPSDWGSF